jgi:cytidylate kinase
MPMSVITISRGTFSGGKMLAECVAGKLGYQCIDRELIVGRAAAWGVSQEDLRTAIQKPPSILGQSRHTQYIYVALIQAALTQSARSGNAIYHGLAGHLLLMRVPHILRVRIIAPLETRIRMVQDRLRYGRAEAISYIEKMDRERRKWTHFLYDADWADPSLYDLVLNLERMSIQEAGDIICSAAKQPCFEFTPECERAMDDLALASRVRANLAIDPSTSEVEVDVTADAGSVSISGEVRSANQRKEVIRIARAVPGVKSVQLDKLAVVAQF